MPGFSLQTNQSSYGRGVSVLFSIIHVTLSKKWKVTGFILLFICEDEVLFNKKAIPAFHS